MNYIEIISKNYPTIGCSIVGDPEIYDNIIWDNPNDIIPKATLDGLVLSTVRAGIWEKIKEYRDSRKFKGIYVSGKWFHNDADSRTQWLGLKDKGRDVLASGGSTTTVLTINHPVYGVVPINWTTMDGTSIQVTVQLAFDVVEKTGDLDGVIYGTGQYHKAYLYSSPTPETYNYKVGWPAVYGE